MDEMYCSNHVNTKQELGKYDLCYLVGTDTLQMQVLGKQATLRRACWKPFSMTDEAVLFALLRLR